MLSPYTKIDESFRALADSSDVMFWMTDVNKLCCFLNAEWLRFTGRTFEQEQGNGWVKGVHPADFVGCLKLYSSKFDQRKAFKTQYRLKRHDGVYCWVSSHGQPRYLANGAFAGYVGACTDLGEEH